MISWVVASVVVGVVTAQVSTVTPATPRVHLELPVFALLGDGVHLREEYRGDEDPSDDNNANGVGWVVEVGRGEVVDDGPGSQDWDDADSGAGHPASLVIIPLNPEH